MFFPHTFLSRKSGEQGCMCLFFWKCTFQFFSRLRKFRLKFRFDMFEGREQFIKGLRNSHMSRGSEACINR